MISEVNINDNSEICSEKVLSNEDDNIDSEEDVDINNKIKQQEKMTMKVIVKDWC
jgi:hypothetical protein